MLFRSVKDIYRLDPFGNELVVYNLTGEEVKRLLAAICRADDYGPAFVSEIQYKIALGKDNKEVKKVEVKMPDGSKFDEKRTYKVVVNSYVASVSNYEKADECSLKIFLVVAISNLSLVILFQGTLMIQSM